jgi:Holliday junction resolvase RusA-like endonuclease
LPWPKGAAGNNLYMSVGRRRVLTPAARAWRDDAIARILSTAPGIWFTDQDAVAAWPMHLSIVGYEPDKRRRDADGLIKATQDAVALALGFDDKRIRKVEAELVAKGAYPPGVEGPCLLVELTYLVKE